MTIADFLQDPAYEHTVTLLVLHVKVTTFTYCLTGSSPIKAITFVLDVYKRQAYDYTSSSHKAIKS